MSKLKGRLDRPKTFQLLRWIELKKVELSSVTCVAAAALASRELGFEVTFNVLRNICSEMGDVKFARQKYVRCLTAKHTPKQEDIVAIARSLVALAQGLGELRELDPRVVELAMGSRVESSILSTDIKEMQ